MAPYFPGTALYPGTALWPEYNGELQPSVTNAEASLTGNTVSFSGTIVPKSELRTYWWFEYGHTTAYGTEAPVVAKNGGTAGTATVTHTERNLPGGPYKFRLTAWNGAGTASSAAGTFTVPDRPTGIIGVASGGLWEHYVPVISEFAYRRRFIHEGQRVQ